jgi:DNA-directed RNA polymerase specialized sigma24 family protein
VNTDWIFNTGINNHRARQREIQTSYSVTPAKQLAWTGTARLSGGVAVRAASTLKPSAEEAERALLTLVSSRDRRAMDDLYILYFARLANFFRSLTERADLVEDLITDTMYEVWNSAASIDPATSASVAIMKLAYRQLPACFADEERVVIHLVYARGHSREDIAKIMTISCTYVDVMLRDARHRLSK